MGTPMCTPIGTHSGTPMSFYRFVVLIGFLTTILCRSELMLKNIAKRMQSLKGIRRKNYDFYLKNKQQKPNRSNQNSNPKKINPSKLIKLSVDKFINSSYS